MYVQNRQRCRCRPLIKLFIDDSVLVTFTNQIFKDHNFLVVHWKLFRGKRFVPVSINDISAFIKSNFFIGFLGRLSERELQMISIFDF